MYDIKYFDDVTGERLFFSKTNPLKVMNFEYRRNQKIVEDRFNESLKVFMSDVLDVKKTYVDSSYEKEYVNGVPYGGPPGIFEPIYFDIFTKLGYLYLDLIEHKSYMYPFIYTPHTLRSKNQLQAGGHGRALIAYRYFPEFEFDISVHSSDYGVGSEEICHRFIDSVLENRYWKDFDLSNKVIIMTIENFQDLYYIKSIDITDEDYFNNYKARIPESFIEKSANIELWNSIKESIINFDVNNYNDLVVLLDQIIFDNLSLTKKLYTWKFK
jgi:hypothetical protein